jgi:hypothetical protein
MQTISKRERIAMSKLAPAGIEKLDQLLGGKTKRTPIRWDEAEWNDLVEVIDELQRATPELTLVQAIKAAQEQLVKTRRWKADRCRQISTVQTVDPIRKKLRDLRKAQHTAYQQREELLVQQAALERKLKQNDPDSLSDEEVVTFFAERVLSHLPAERLLAGFSADELIGQLTTPVIAGYAVQRVLEDYLPHRSASLALGEQLKTLSQVVSALGQSNGHANGHTNGHANGHNNGAALRLPLVVLIGCHQGQFARLEQRFGGQMRLVAVDKMHLSKHSLPEKTQAVVTLGKFTSAIQRGIIRDRAKELGLGGDRCIMVMGGTQSDRRGPRSPAAQTGTE